MGIVSGGGGGGTFNGGTITTPLDIEQAGPSSNTNALTVVGAGSENDGDHLASLTGSDGSGYELFTDGSIIHYMGFDTTNFIIKKKGGALVFQTQGGIKVGFFGATPVVKQTVAGAKLPSDVVLASLLTALVNLGLITDNST